MKTFIAVYNLFLFSASYDSLYCTVNDDCELKRWRNLFTLFLVRRLVVAVTEMKLHIALRLYILSPVLKKVMVLICH